MLTVKCHRVSIKSGTINESKRQQKPEKSLRTSLYNLNGFLTKSSYTIYSVALLQRISYVFVEYEQFKSNNQHHRCLKSWSILWNDLLTLVSNTSRSLVYFCDTNGSRHGVESIVTDRVCHKRRSDWHWQHDAWRLPNTAVVWAAVAVSIRCLSCRCHTGFSADRGIRIRSMRDECWSRCSCCCSNRWRMVRAVTHYWAESSRCDSPWWLDSRRRWKPNWWTHHSSAGGHAIGIGCRTMIRYPAASARDRLMIHLDRKRHQSIDVQ